MHEKEPAFDSLNRKALFVQGHREQGPLSCSSVGDLSALVAVLLSVLKVTGHQADGYPVSLRDAHAFT